MANESKTVNQEIRINYLNTENDDCSLQGVFLSVLDFKYIGSYKSMNTTLSGNQTKTISGANMLYISANRDFKVVIDDNATLSNGRVFAYVNPTTTFSATIQPCQSSDCSVEFSIFYAVITES